VKATAVFGGNGMICYQTYWI